MSTRLPMAQIPVEEEELMAVSPANKAPNSESHHVSIAQNVSEESDDERRRREEEESIELARMLMAEEAMASYQNSIQLLRSSANELSQEDYDALQAVLAEEQREQEAEEAAELEDEDGELSYEAMLQLGERIGDVKSERWGLVAEKHIAKLPVFSFDPDCIGTDLDDSEHKCLVCQYDYEKDERLRRLPCGHCFHADCVDQWLKDKDFCPYCRSAIVDEGS